MKGERYERELSFCHYFSGVFGCGLNTGIYKQAWAVEPVLIGAPTAINDVSGSQQRKSLIMAAEEINGKGGITIKGVKHPLKLEFSDTRGGEPGVPVSEGVLAYEKLITKEKPVALVPGDMRSEVVLAATDLFTKYKVVHMAATAMSPKYGAMIKENYDRYKYCFRISLDSRHSANLSTGYMAHLGKEFGFKKAYILMEDVAYARAVGNFMSEWFKKNGWEVVGFDALPVGTTDYSISLVKVKKTEAQVIYVVSSTFYWGAMVKQWATMKPNAMISGAIVPVASEKAWEEFEGKVESVLQEYLEIGNMPVKSVPKSIEYYNAYKKRWGEGIITHHGPAAAYDGLYVLVDAIERAGTVETDKLITALEQTDYRGAMGRIRFGKEDHQALYGTDPDKEAISCVIQWQKPGKRVAVYPKEIAEGKIQLPPWMK